MMEASKNLFIKIYFSNKAIQLTPYTVKNRVCVWFDRDEEEILYLMSPETYNDYKQFVENLEKETPLLAELK